MQDGEAAKHQAVHDAAVHKAGQLHNVGWEQGARAAIWARAVSDELERHETARRDFGQRQDREAWERIHSTALMLVVAIDQVLSFERRVRKLTGDAELARARKDFDAVGPRAKALRDLVAHLDEYATGTGRRQTGEAQPPITDPYLSHSRRDIVDRSLCRIAARTSFTEESE
ncbi:MAG: hypothetical protein ACRDPC_15280 [Solirubrobacteraceae bacterium]